MESLRTIEESVDSKSIDDFIAWLNDIHDGNVKVEKDTFGPNGPYHITTPVSNMTIFLLGDGYGSVDAFDGSHNRNPATKGNTNARTLKFWYNSENKALDGKRLRRR